VIQVVLLIVAMYAILSLIGAFLLTSVDTQTRDALLPAAPLLGAALIAAVSSTTTRWLSMRASLMVVAAVLVVVLVVAYLRRSDTPGRPRWRLGRGAVAGLLLAPVLTIGGAGIAALPSIWVDDHRPVDATLIVDQFYFASTSTYLTDQSLLPGPYWNPDDWIDSATPSEGPVVDVISNRLRYGQAALSSALSIAVGQDPSDTVTSVSIMLLVLTGPAIYVAATLLGARRRWALAAVPLATSSFFLITQSLEGKNDGLLGISLALLALALTYAVTRRAAFAWPLVIMAAGLAATYSELVLVLVAPVALLALLGPRAKLTERLNVVAGSWALAAVLTPWAWIWLAQSAKVGGRFSQGSTPFDDRSGWALARAAVGITPAGSVPAALCSAAAVGCLVAVVTGIVWAVRRSPARGAAIGVVLALAALEYAALRSDAGNLQYRVAQIGYPFLMLFAVLGWDSLAAERPRWSPRWAGHVVPVTAGAIIGVFALGNVATAATHLPRERAVEQHVPGSEIDEAASWVREAGPADVSLLVPKFPDLIWLALELRDDVGVGYPVVPAIYLGSFPRWDRQPDRFYLTGVGASVSADARVVHRNAHYQLVELGSTGTILTPFQPTFYWARPTYMRGFPCARDGSQLLLVRGREAPKTFQVASRTARELRSNLVLDVDGDRISQAAPPRREEDWLVQTFEAPDFDSAIINIELTSAATDAGSTALPLRLGAPDADQVKADDTGLTDFCMRDEADGMDGYDRDITTLRTSD